MIKKTFNKLAEFPRLRIVLFLVLIVVVLFIISRIFSSRVAPTPAPPSSIASTQITPNQPAMNSTSQQYQALAQQEQQNQVQQAASSGQSFFAGVFSGGQNVNNSTNAPGLNHPLNTQTVAVNPQNFYKQQLQQQTAPSTASHSNNVFHMGFFGANANNAQGNATQQTQQLTQQMNQQLQSLSNDWKLPTGTMVAGTQPSVAPSAPTTPSGPVIIKAGTVLYAVLDTALDSDQPGTPVMARIVTGQYQGAKLLGTFARENDALVLQFTTMSLPNTPTSINIGTAFAIDGVTAQNALASSVDNHYLLRYGSVFAAGFLQGFGNAYNPNNYGNPCAGTSPGANCNVTINNGNNTTPATSSAIYQGLGQVGTNLASAMQANFNTPPTVTLNQGTGMGILFMNDVKLQ